MCKKDQRPLCFAAASLLLIASVVSGELAYAPIALVLLILGIMRK